MAKPTLKPGADHPMPPSLAATQETSSFILPDDADEGYAESTTTSYVSSIASSIRRGIEENGRLYPSYGKNASLLPMDDDELDRHDLQHMKFRLLLGGKLHLAPIVEEPKAILDLGTGTGIWAVTFAVSLSYWLWIGLTGFSPLLLDFCVNGPLW
jgi:hypothetical protein